MSEALNPSDSTTRRRPGTGTILDDKSAMNLLKRGGARYRKGERERLDGILDLLELHERGGFEAIRLAKGIESDSGTQRYIAEMYGVTQGRISQLVALGRLLELLPHVEEHSVTEWMLRPLVRYLDMPQLAVEMFQEALKLAEEEGKRLSCRFVKEAVKIKKRALPTNSGDKAKYYGRNTGETDGPDTAGGTVPAAIAPLENDHGSVDACLRHVIATIQNLRNLPIHESKRAELGELVDSIVLCLQEFRHAL